MESFKQVVLGLEVAALFKIWKLFTWRLGTVQVFKVAMNNAARDSLRKGYRMSNACGRRNSHFKQGKNGCLAELDLVIKCGSQHRSSVFSSDNLLITVNVVFGNSLMITIRFYRRSCTKKQNTNTPNRPNKIKQQQQQQTKQQTMVNPLKSRPVRARKTLEQYPTATSTPPLHVQLTFVQSTPPPFQ